jgi:molecular chaperone GrpE
MCLWCSNAGAATSGVGRTRTNPPERPVAAAPTRAHVVFVLDRAEQEQLARALNDLEAAKARVERDAAHVARETRTKLVAELLPVMDNLDRAIANAESSGDAPGVVEGARLVHAQLEAVLRGYGLERIDAISARFDPAVHEAVGVVDVRDRGFHDIVIDQLEPCYRLGSALLRPAKVVVGRCAGAARATDDCP